MVSGSLHKKGLHFFLVAFSYCISHCPDAPEASFIVPNFKHFVNSSSCNSLFFGLILSSFLSPAISLLPILLLGCSENEAEKDIIT